MTPTQPTDTSQSFEKSAIPLLLALNPSRSQRIISVSCHTAAVIAVFLANLPLVVQLLISAIIIFSLQNNYRKESQSQRVIWRSGNRWVIEEALPLATQPTGTATYHNNNMPAHNVANNSANNAANDAQIGNEQGVADAAADTVYGHTAVIHDHDSVAAELHSIDFFSRWLVILTLRTQAGQKHKFVIPRDSLPKDTFRLLRVRLRIEGFSLLNPDSEY